jgi:hypothetical protein
LTTADDNDRIRAIVLRAFYDVDREQSGMAQQTGNIAQLTGIVQNDVNLATDYLAQRGLLFITLDKAAMGDYQTFRMLMAKITADGIDVIERPESYGPNFLGASIIHQIVNVNGTLVAAGGVAHEINQQVVGGDNAGVMVNASTTGDIQPPATSFPIERLREMLREGSVERKAAEDLAVESRSPRPKMSRISTSIDILKGVTSIANVAKTVIDWLGSPGVAEWLHSVTDHLQL